MNLEKQKKIVELAKYIALSAVIGKFLSIPANIFIAKFLGPKSFGVLAIIDTIMIYFSYTNLGILMNLERQVPIEKASLSDKEIKITYSTAFSNYCFTTLFSVILIFLAYLLGITFKTDGSITIFLIIGFILLTRNLNNFVSSFIKAEGEFDVFGKNSFLLSILKPILTLLLAYEFGLYGMLTALVLLNLISALYIFYLSPTVRVFSIRWNKKKTQELFGTGIKLFLGNKLESFLFTIGILLISNFGSIEEVGVYSFALMLISIRQFPFSKAISIVVSREMNLVTGEKGEKNFKEFNHFFQKNIAVYLLFVSLVMGVVLLTFILVTEFYLPKYLKAIPLMQVFFSLVVIHSARIYSDYFFNATNQMEVKIKHTLAAILLSLSLGTLALYFDYGALGIAMSMVISVILTGLPQIYRAILQVSDSKKFSRILLFKLITLSILIELLILFFSSESWMDFLTLEENPVIVVIKFLLSILGYILSCFCLFELFFSKFKISNYSFVFIKNVFIKNKTDA
tara:strand:+ start:57 stop:1595 length:1539 start_codon:yes stop_codon:yes gene_type:complete